MKRQIALVVVIGLVTLTWLVARSAFALGTVPSTPTDVALTPVTNGSCPADSLCVQISWNASADDSSGRFVYRIERNGVPIGWTQAPRDLGYRPSFRDAQAVWGSNRYRVMAIGEDGDTSGWSPPIEIIMGTGCT